VKLRTRFIYAGLRPWRVLVNPVLDLLMPSQTKMSVIN
jgi:hypothetical protein